MRSRSWCGVVGWWGLGRAGCCWVSVWRPRLAGSLAAMSRRPLPTADLRTFPNTSARPWRTGTCLAWRLPWCTGTKSFSPRGSGSGSWAGKTRSTRTPSSQIGSVSKSFGAAAIGALVDDGLVHWDDPVVEHLPWFQVKDPEITREMTIRDLLSHQSGMPGDAFPALTIMDARTAAERVRHLDNQNPAQGEFSLQQPGLRGRGAGGGGRDRKDME